MPGRAVRGRTKRLRKPCVRQRRVRGAGAHGGAHGRERLHLRDHRCHRRHRVLGIESGRPRHPTCGWKRRVRADRRVLRIWHVGLRGAGRHGRHRVLGFRTPQLLPCAGLALGPARPVSRRRVRAGGNGRSPRVRSAQLRPACDVLGFKQPAWPEHAARSRDRLRRLPAAGRGPRPHLRRKNGRPAPELLGTQSLSSGVVRAVRHCVRTNQQR